MAQEPLGRCLVTVERGVERLSEYDDGGLRADVLRRIEAVAK